MKSKQAWLFIAFSLLSHVMSDQDRSRFPLARMLRPPTSNRPRTIKTRKTRQDRTKLGPVQTQTGPKTCTGCKELQARRHRETDFARPVAIYHHRYHRPSSAPHLQSSACLPEWVLANYKELVQGSGWCDDRPATPPPPPMFVLCAHIFVIREVKSHHASFSTTPPPPLLYFNLPCPRPRNSAAHLPGAGYSYASVSFSQPTCSAVMTAAA